MTKSVTEPLAASNGSAPQGVAIPGTESGISGVGGVLPPVLDACCSLRSFWFDQHDPRAVFVDKRREEIVLKWNDREDVHCTVDPDIQADFTDLPFPDESFALVVFDPPHIVRMEALGNITKKYGHLFGDWREMIRGGFTECFRVLRPLGTLIFKWNEAEIPLAEILTLTPEKPLFGHQSGAKAKTHWVAFLKGGGGGFPSSPAEKEPNQVLAPKNAHNTTEGNAAPEA